MQLRVLLHYYFSGLTWKDQNEVSPASTQAHDYWLRADCMTLTSTGPVLTERGYAMVRLWLRQPLPTLVSYYADDRGERIKGDHDE